MKETKLKRITRGALKELGIEKLVEKIIVGLIEYKELSSEFIFIGIVFKEGYSEDISEGSFKKLRKILEERITRVSDSHNIFIMTHTYSDEKVILEAKGTTINMVRLFFEKVRAAFMESMEEVIQGLNHKLLSESKEKK